MMWFLLYYSLYYFSTAPDNAKPTSRRCEADVNITSTAKPMSKRMRSRCQDECEADVNIMRSLCQGECNADVKTNAKPMFRVPRSRCREGTPTCMLRMEVHTHANKFTWNENTQSDMICWCLHWLLAFLLSLWRNIVSPFDRASRSNVRPGCSKIIYIFHYI